jgi:hypothetical protein
MLPLLVEEAARLMKRRRRLRIKADLLGNKVPFIREGAGSREALVLFGVNALFKRIDQISAPERYARQIARLLPGHGFTILGYAGSSYQATKIYTARVRRRSHFDRGVVISHSHH